jgi:hypothetical protein
VLRGHPSVVFELLGSCGWREITRSDDDHLGLTRKPIPQFAITARWCISKCLGQVLRRRSPPDRRADLARQVGDSPNELEVRSHIALTVSHHCSRAQDRSGSGPGIRRRSDSCKIWFRAAEIAAVRSHSNICWPFGDRDEGWLSGMRKVRILCGRGLLGSDGHRSGGVTPDTQCLGTVVAGFRVHAVFALAAKKVGCETYRACVFRSEHKARPGCPSASDKQEPS